MMFSMIFTVAMLIAFALGSNEILQHPKSKLVPAGVEVRFHCKVAGYLDSYWVVDGQVGVTSQHRSVLETRGFFSTKILQDSIATLSLRVMATTDKNGTVLFCSSVQKFRTDEAVLFVIENLPTSPNPSIDNPNATSILLRWSPPFLWPGYSIEYYNVSITNNGKITYGHSINATFNDAVVSFIKFAADPNIESCDRLEFLISAVSSDIDCDTEDLASFHVYGGYIPTSSDIAVKDLDINVLYRPDGTPIISIKVELTDNICSYQDINYTFCIDTINENETQSHINDTLGPYQQRGPGIISKIFMTEFEKDREYTLTLLISTAAGSIASDIYSFNTTLQYRMDICNDLQALGDDIYVYKLVMIISLTVVAFISQILLIIIISRPIHLCIRERQGKKLTDSARRVHNAMVHNPIYEGPLYETAETQFGALTTTTTMVNTLSNHTSITSNHHYMEQPRSKYTPQNRQPSLSLANHSSATTHDHIATVPGFQPEYETLVIVPPQIKEKCTVAMMSPANITTDPAAMLNFNGENN